MRHPRTQYTIAAALGVQSVLWLLCLALLRDRDAQLLAAAIAGAWLSTISVAVALYQHSRKEYSSLRGIDRQLDEVGTTLGTALAQRGVDERTRHDDLVATLATLVTAATETRVKVDEGFVMASEQRRSHADRLARAITATDQAQFRQFEATQMLRTLLRPQGVLPYSRHWAASPDLLLSFVQAIQGKPGATVVECGSGLSTVWMGLALRAMGTGRGVALEHEQEFRDKTLDAVERHGLEDWVEVRLAPLVPVTIGKDTFSWYTTDALADVRSIDVLLVDGPPALTGPLARYPAVPVLMDRLVDGARILLDDTIRPEERAASDRWLEEFPRLSRELLPHEKGCHQFTLRPAEGRG
jgi:predicted O-methyltransferase YrrM